MAHSVIVIPARLHSTRLPRKLLLRETGQSLLEHTYVAARRSLLASDVVIATDHEEIMVEATRFGATAIMTDPNAASGTDRVAEVAASLPDADIIVNVQGDEPELAAESIDRVIELLDNDPAAVMATLATPIRCRSRLEDPNCVKVVLAQNGRATYFSRSPIPFVRDGDEQLAEALSSEPAVFLQHIGLYAYRRDFLLQLAALPPTTCEQLEKLEQLRVLESGHSIQVGIVDEPTIGIDTADDYQEFVKRSRGRMLRAAG